MLEDCAHNSWSPNALGLVNAMILLVPLRNCRFHLKYRWKNELKVAIANPTAARNARDSGETWKLSKMNSFYLESAIISCRKNGTVRRSVLSILLRSPTHRSHCFSIEYGAVKPVVELTIWGDATYYYVSFEADSLVILIFTSGCFLVPPLCQSLRAAVNFSMA